MALLPLEEAAAALVGLVQDRCLFAVLCALRLEAFCETEGLSAASEANASAAGRQHLAEPAWHDFITSQNREAWLAISHDLLKARPGQGHHSRHHPHHPHHHQSEAGRARVKSALQLAWMSVLMHLVSRAWFWSHYARG